MKTHLLATLPYAPNALEPYMSQETIEYHHGKHLQAYVNNLNGLIPGTEFENASLEEIIKKASGPLFNNAAQILNHEIFFAQLSPNAKTVPTGALADAIVRDFGSLEAFKEQFNKAATGLFGSGWVWLAIDPAGKLSIVAQSNAGNPITESKRALMGIDVWEHSYYIDYRNRRAEYIGTFWNILDWKYPETQFSK